MTDDCPLKGTKHYDACCLTAAAESCEFKHECKAMVEDEQRNLFTRFNDMDLLLYGYELLKMVRYYESAEGEWANERLFRLATKDEFEAVLVEVERRGLKFDMNG